MTREEILDLSGRDLDQAVAKLVMGGIDKPYSDDIAAAWMVVGRLQDRCYNIAIEWSELRGRWRVRVSSPDVQAVAEDPVEEVVICRAALLAVAGEALGVEVGDDD